jgi:tetratricopeptide (TPR) repeat protein
MRVRTRTERIEPKEVVGQLRQHVAADPSDFESRRSLARAEQAVGRPEIADELIEACLRERPNDRGAWLDRLKILDARHDRDGLLRAIERMPTAFSDDAEVLHFRGIAKEAKGDLAGATDDLRRSVAIDPFREEAQFFLASLEQRQNLAETAESHRERHRELSKARREMVSAVLAFQSEYEKEPSRLGEGAASAAGQVSELCRMLGWDSLAEDWRRLGPGGTSAERMR